MSAGMTVEEARALIARRAAADIAPGEVVNLGVGIPTMIPGYLPAGAPVILHSENGLLGMGPAPRPEDVDPDLTNAGAQPVTVHPGGSCFDVITSVAMMRGGHLDAVFMGAFQVDAHGNLANWLLSAGEIKGGIGGAMDLAVGAKRLIVLMEHTTRDGRPRIVERCELPLTAMGVVDRVITELAVIDVGPQGLVLRELMGDATEEDVMARTAAPLHIDLRPQADTDERRHDTEA